MPVTLQYKLNVMIHTYKVTGMTCASCQEKVENLLGKIEDVTGVNVDLSNSEVKVTMQEHVPTSVLQNALKEYPRYQLTEKHHIPSITAEETKSWWQTYRPILLIFAYITGITLLIQFVAGQFNWMTWMNHFMAGFFLTFSFFKMLNLSGFADSYTTYDIIAKHWRGYGYIYAFIELALGLAYTFHFHPILTNTVTLAVMTISLIGVLQTVLNKRKIKCACLGDVFNLPMSTVTVIEDGLMIGMSAVMLVVFYQ